MNTVAILREAEKALADAVEVLDAGAKTSALPDSRRVLEERANWYRNTCVAVHAEINRLSAGQ